MPPIAALGITASYILYASVAVSLIGAGVSEYGKMQQASQARRTADYNAAIQRQGAKIDAAQAEYQANASAAQAQAQANVQKSNAAALDNQALQLQAQGREKAQRMREDQLRMLAATRTGAANSGVENEGTPLLILANDAKLSELSIQDSAYQTELDSRDKQRQADLQRYGAGFSLLDSSLQNFQSLSDAMKQRIAYQQADLTSLAGKSQAQTYQLGGISSIFNGIGDAGQLAMSTLNRTPQKGAPKLGGG